MNCWNCEGNVEQTTTVSIGLPAGGQVTLSLCSDCHTSVYLPLVGTTPELAGHDARNRSILVVDDDPGVRLTLQSALDDEGFSVDVAADGADALKKAREHVPDAIILDLRMPVMDGREFLKAWRQTEPARSVPVLAISAHELSLTAEQLGVDAYLPKPFNLDRVMETLEALIARPGHGLSGALA